MGLSYEGQNKRKEHNPVALNVRRSYTPRDAFQTLEKLHGSIHLLDAWESRMS